MAFEPFIGVLEAGPELFSGPLVFGAAISAEKALYPWKGIHRHKKTKRKKKTIFLAIYLKRLLNLFSPNNSPLPNNRHIFEKSLVGK
ncbi:MAG: hypothetical protein HY879_16485 [Deltaproteobacteria bacterium]|nr:hypothetical protein [Deltaproteobacteria bacterium]